VLQDAAQPENSQIIHIELSASQPNVLHVVFEFQFSQAPIRYRVTLTNFDSPLQGGLFFFNP
jgi:hypothetical protein